MGMVRRLALLAAFVAVLVVGWKFAAANADEVHVDYLLGTFSGVRVWVLVVATFVLGALAGIAVCLVEMARLGLLSRRYRKAIGRLEAELHGLRTLPLSAAPGATEREGGAGKGA